MSKRRSIDQKKELVTKVLDLAENNDLPISDACSQVGVPLASFYFMKRQVKENVSNSRKERGFKPNVDWSHRGVKPTMSVAVGSGKEMSALFREILRSI